MGRIMSAELRTSQTAISNLHGMSSLIFCKLHYQCKSPTSDAAELLTRYYQVIMMIDIFQYSNMYTLRKNIQWLADEAHVKDECGPYVTRPGEQT